MKRGAESSNLEARSRLGLELTRELIDVIWQAGRDSLSAWLRRAGKVKEDPANLFKAFEDGAVAWLDRLMTSRAALGAMFAPLGIGLRASGQMSRWKDELLHAQRFASVDDVEEMMRALRMVESKVLDVAESVEELRDDVSRVEQAVRGGAEGSGVGHDTKQLVE